MRRLAALPLATLALAACGGNGGSGSPRDVLPETAANLGEIRSGKLTLTIRVSSEDAEAGFDLEGPFALAESSDALPEAELAYTQVAGSESESITFISTGEQAFVETSQGTFELPEEQTRTLRGTGAGDEGTAGLEELDVADWFVEPEVSDGGEVGGADTDRVTSNLDVVAAANDLVDLASAFGASGMSTLEGDDAEQLRRAVESATVEVFTGKDDRLLRRLVVEAAFRASPPRELEEAFSNLPGADFRLELAISDPNGEVTVEAPSDAQPLPGG